MRILNLKIILLLITICASLTNAQQPSVQVTGQITTANGPEIAKRGVPITFSGDAFEEAVSDTTDSLGYEINLLITNIAGKGNVPLTFTIGNFPNPFNPHTRIWFTLPQTENVQLNVYDLLGKHIVTLVDKTMLRGKHTVYWDARDNHGRQIAEGMYFYRIITDNYSRSGKMIYMHGTVPSTGTESLAQLLKPATTVPAEVDIAETDSTEPYLTDVQLTIGQQNIKDFTVSWKNFPPAWTQLINDINDLEDQVTIIDSLDHKTFDFNNDQLTYQVLHLPNGWNQIIDGNQVQIIPPQDWYGTINGIQLKASDGEYQATSNTFSITKTNVNDPPTITMDNYTINRGDSLEVILNVNDIDNTNQELTVSAQYNPQDLAVTINNTAKTAQIKAIGNSHPTININWQVQDLEPLSGYDQSQITITPAYYVTFQLLDPVDDLPWGLTDFIVRIGTERTYNLTSDQTGQATALVPSDTGRVLIPYNADHYETQQPLEAITQDGTITVPVVHRDFPLEEFVTFQGGIPRPYVYITNIDPRFVNPAADPADPDTIRWAFYEPDTTGNSFQAFQDTIRSWNQWIFPRMTKGKYVMSIPDLTKNVEFYQPQSLQDEIDKNLEIADTTNVLPDNALAGHITSYFNLIASSGVNDNFWDPSQPHFGFATRGYAVTEYFNSAGFLLGELGAVILTQHGELGGFWDDVAVYGGNAQFPPFVIYLPYRTQQIAAEELIGNFKYGLPVKTKVTNTSITPPRKGT